MAYALAFVVCFAGSINFLLVGQDTYHMAIWVVSAATALVCHWIFSR